LALAIGAIGFFALIIVEGPTLAMLRHLPGNPRAARAIDPPISPKPISAILLKCGAALTCAP